MAQATTMPRRDFFVSYTDVDRTWAEWLAWQLEAAGYSVTLQAWDFVPGGDWVHQMQQATAECARTIAVLSSAYVRSAFGEAEWRVAFANDPTGERGLLVPVRIEETQLPGLLRTRTYVDVVGLSRETAKQRLLDAVSQRRGKPAWEPSFPGSPQAEPLFPGRGPHVTNLPVRNPSFVGRSELLETLYEDLEKQPVAIYGLGGIGKTQLALQYANQHATAYDIAWWIPAGRTATAVNSLALLARHLRVEERADQYGMLADVLDELRRRDRWLLIYDNADGPNQLVPLLPFGGPGHVLITSRNRAWSQVARPLQLDVLRRRESVRLLQRRTGSQDELSAASLAEFLGDLPLAIEEAAAYVEETQVSLNDYLQLARERTIELFGLHHPAGEEQRVATTWSVSLDRIRVRAPAAEALLELCAFFGPEEIPRDLPTRYPELLPPKLVHTAREPLAYNEAVRALSQYSLVNAARTTFGVHPLVQAVVRTRLPRSDRRRWAGVAVVLLHESFPDRSREVAAWPVCQRLLPHVLVASEHAERLGAASQQAGSLLDRVAAYLQARGQPRQALPVAERALRTTQKALGADDVATGERHDTLGRVLLDLREYGRARDELERALAIFEAAVGPRHPDVAILRGTLAQVLGGLGDLDEARAQLEQALGSLETALGPDDPVVGRVHNELAHLLWADWDLLGARVQLQRALRIMESTYGTNHPSVATICSNLASVLHDTGDLEGARAKLLQALAIFEATFGSHHPEVGTVRSKLGGVLRDLGDLEGSRAQLVQALVILEAALGPDHPNVAILRGNLGRVLRDLGDLQGARAPLAQALAAFEAAVGPAHRNAVILRADLQQVERELGEAGDDA